MATRSGEGVLRLANAVLNSSGGFEAKLVLPGQAVSGSDAEQLGLGTPQLQEVTLFPAVWRKTGVEDALLLSADSVDRLLEAQGYASVLDLLATAVGIAVDEVLYGITGCHALTAAGQVYAYKISVRAPAWA